VSYEVSEPILNSPYAEPKKDWYIREGESPLKRKLICQHLRYFIGGQESKKCVLE